MTRKQPEARGLVLAQMLQQDATIAALRARNAELLAALGAAREYGVQARLREKAAEDRRIHDTDAIRAQNAELMAALVECAEDLAAELNARYPESLRKYPSMGRQYDRDMAPVIKARALAAAGHKQGSGE